MTEQDVAVNHEEAFQLAMAKRGESNLARCYIEQRDTIERQAARIAELEEQLELAISKVPFPEQQCPGAVAMLTNNTVQSKEAGDD